MSRLGHFIDKCDFLGQGARHKMAGMRIPSISQNRRLLAKRALSAQELLQAHVKQIQAHNPRLNALPTLCLDRALAEAKAIDKNLSGQKKSGQMGPLTGMPYAAKDMFDTQGVRTTYGSPIFADRVPEKDAEIVRRIRQAGAILVGKSNTPEFAAGSQTFNTVFGATCNPWDPTKTCGGSTGGGAVALVSGMVSVADGSDLAASLRNPANFCHVVGLRPSSHLEPRLQTGLNPFNTLSMVGPMARTVEDLREIFLAIFDPQGCAPNRSLSDWVVLRDAQAKARPRWTARKKLRIGWAPDWGGLAVDHQVATVIKSIGEHLSRHQIELIEAFPTLPDFRSAFLTLRGEYFVAEFNELLQHHRDRLKDTVIWNIEQGLALKTTELARAQKIRHLTRQRLEQFMALHQLDAIVGPCNQVLPFDLNTPYISELNGAPLETYIDWLASNFLVTVAGLPALSLPAGFAHDPSTECDLPVGLQLIGRWSEDLHLMAVAEHLEQVLAPMSRRSPPLI